MPSNLPSKKSRKNKEKREIFRCPFSRQNGFAIAKNVNFIHKLPKFPRMTNEKSDQEGPQNINTMKVSFYVPVPSALADLPDMDDTNFWLDLAKKIIANACAIRQNDEALDLARLTQQRCEDLAADRSIDDHLHNNPRYTEENHREGWARYMAENPDVELLNPDSPSDSDSDIEWIAPPCMKDCNEEDSLNA